MNKVKTNTKKSFWKFIFIPFWNVSKRQKVIEEYAENGYLPTLIIFSILYRFKRCDPQKVKCFFALNYYYKTHVETLPTYFMEYFDAKTVFSIECDAELIIISDKEEYGESFQKYYREMNLYRDYCYFRQKISEIIGVSAVTLVLNILFLILKFPPEAYLVHLLFIPVLMYSANAALIYHIRCVKSDEQPIMRNPEPIEDERIKKLLEDRRKNAMPKKKHKKKRYQYEK